MAMITPRSGKRVNPRAGELYRLPRAEDKVGRGRAADRSPHMATLSMARVFAVPRKARRRVQPKPGQDVIEAMAAPWLGQREAGHVAGKNEGDWAMPAHRFAASAMDRISPGAP
jgi:hypothetical protein